jgi:hypothetical protein
MYDISETCSTHDRYEKFIEICSKNPRREELLGRSMRRLEENIIFQHSVALRYLIVLFSIYNATILTYLLLELSPS